MFNIHPSSDTVLAGPWTVARDGPFPLGIGENDPSAARQLPDSILLTNEQITVTTTLHSSLAGPADLFLLPLKLDFPTMQCSRSFMASPTPRKCREWFQQQAMYSRACTTAPFDKTTWYLLLAPTEDASSAL